MDGLAVDLDAERERVVQCIEAVIKRGVSKVRRVLEGVAGLRLEQCTTLRIGLLSEVTRIFHENNLAVTRAEVLTREDKIINTLYVFDASGFPLDSKIIDSVIKQIGETMVIVEHNRQQLNLNP